MDTRQVFASYDLESGLSSGAFDYCPKCASSMATIELEGHLRKACPQCGFIQFRNPAPAVAVLIVHQNRFLLGKRLAGVAGGALHSGDDFTEARWFDFGKPLPAMAFEEDLYIIERYSTGDLPRLPVDSRFAGKPAKEEPAADLRRPALKLALFG
jgi:phage FluMu protein Com